MNMFVFYTRNTHFSWRTHRRMRKWVCGDWNRNASHTNKYLLFFAQFVSLCRKKKRSPHECFFFFNQFSIFPRKPRFVLFVAFSVNSCCWLKAKDTGWLHLYLSYTIKIGTNACACVYLIIKWPGDTIIPSVVCIRFGAVLLFFLL